MVSCNDARDKQDAICGYEDGSVNSFDLCGNEGQYRQFFYYRATRFDSTQNGLDVALVRMASEEDWLLSLVKEGMIRYSDLKDGTVSLEDCARMSDYLNVRQENQARINKSLENK